jgi:hypothetical protein
LPKIWHSCAEWPDNHNLSIRATKAFRHSHILTEEIDLT